MLGSTLQPTPNYAALTPEKERTISRRVNTELLNRWKRLRGIMKRKKNKKNDNKMHRLTQLNNILTNVVLNAAKSVLGVTTPAPPPTAKPLVDLEGKWDALAKLVGSALGATIDAHMTDAARPALDGPSITQARLDLVSHGIHLPANRGE